MSYPFFSGWFGSHVIFYFPLVADRGKCLQNKPHDHSAANPGYFWVRNIQWDGCSLPMRNTVKFYCYLNFYCRRLNQSYCFPFCQVKQADFPGKMHRWKSEVSLIQKAGELNWIAWGSDTSGNNMQLNTFHSFLALEETWDPPLWGLLGDLELHRCILQVELGKPGAEVSEEKRTI